jgi:hypothetical protein
VPQQPSPYDGIQVWSSFHASWHLRIGNAARHRNTWSLVRRYADCPPHVAIVQRVRCRSCAQPSRAFRSVSRGAAACAAFSSHSHFTSTTLTDVGSLWTSKSTPVGQLWRHRSSASVFASIGMPGSTSMGMSAFRSHSHFTSTTLTDVGSLWTSKSTPVGQLWRHRSSKTVFASIGMPGSTSMGMSAGNLPRISVLPSLTVLRIA